MRQSTTPRGGLILTSAARELGALADELHALRRDASGRRRANYLLSRRVLLLQGWAGLRASPSAR
jgi:hypothetical protein